MRKMDAKRTNTLGNVFAGENTAASEVKIRSFTRGSGSTIPGKIYENPAAITIDTGAEVLIVRKRLDYHGGSIGRNLYWSAENKTSGSRG